MRKLIIQTLCAAFGLAALAGLSGCAQTSAAQAYADVPARTDRAAEDTAVITVAASGTVRLVPDKAAVSFGVTTQEKTAEKAQAKNSEAVNKVVATLKERGVDEKSIRTSSYNMYPQYDWSDGKQQRLVGYVVTTSMSVQDQELDDVGKLISACVDAGINQIDSVRFLCSGYDEAYRQALGDAVAAARLKAEALAAAAGKKLGDPVSITEGWQDTSARYGKAAGNSIAAAESMDLAAPVFQPGETEIAANVTVSYKMQ